MNTALKATAVAVLATPLLWACASDGKTSTSDGAPGVTGQVSAQPTSGGQASAGSGGTQSGSSDRGFLPNIPSLVSVNLRNVLNDIAVKLNIDSANVPINIQLPIQLAANVCGVSINILSVSTGGQANCTATTAPQDLAQVVQQQLAAGGSVGGGAQGGSTATTAQGGASGAATGGATNTTATSSGGIGNTAPTTAPATTTPTTTTPR